MSTFPARGERLSIEAVGPLGFTLDRSEYLDIARDAHPEATLPDVVDAYWACDWPERPPLVGAVTYRKGCARCLICALSHALRDPDATAHDTGAGFQSMAQVVVRELADAGVVIPVGGRAEIARVLA